MAPLPVACLACSRVRRGAGGASGTLRDDCVCDRARDGGGTRGLAVDAGRARGDGGGGELVRVGSFRSERALGEAERRWGSVALLGRDHECRWVLEHIRGVARSGGARPGTDDDVYAAVRAVHESARWALLRAQSRQARPVEGGGAVLGIRNGKGLHQEAGAVGAESGLDVREVSP